MEHDRVEIGAVGPNDRAGFVVYANLPKELRVFPDRIEHRSPEQPIQVDLPPATVVEPGCDGLRRRNTLAAETLYFFQIFL